MCVVKVKEMGNFFWHQGNEMNAKFSLKMGVRFAASLDNFLDVSYKVMYKNAGTEPTILYLR